MLHQVFYHTKSDDVQKGLQSSRGARVATPRASSLERGDEYEYLSCRRSRLLCHHQLQTPAGWVASKAKESDATCTPPADDPTNTYNNILTARGCAGPILPAIFTKSRKVVGMYGQDSISAVRCTSDLESHFFLGCKMLKAQFPVATAVHAVLDIFIWQPGFRNAGKVIPPVLPAVQQACLSYFGQRKHLSYTSTNLMVLFFRGRG